jgi:NADPH:quinone reductase-like Zn-dependent oxidoreductase
MKAVQVVKYGDAVEGVEVREVPEPGAPKTGEVLVGVEFSPINFNDLMVIWGIYAWRPELPATMGNEGVGTVVAIGEGVTVVKAGDRVILPFTVKKWQQRVVVPAEELIVVPPDADPQQAAMMAINPVTAALLLDEYVDLQPGDAVAYNAATSGLAQWLAALAGKRGVRTIGLVRRREGHRARQAGRLRDRRGRRRGAGRGSGTASGIKCSAGTRCHRRRLCRAAAAPPRPQRQARDLRCRLRQADGTAG